MAQGHFNPTVWNVVVAGAWNRAILTPGGIVTRLFGLPKVTPTEVYVPLEGTGWPKVRHGGLTVSPSSTDIDIQANTPDYPTLERAMGIGQTALENLPETPVIAAGYNIRYQGITDSETEYLQTILALLSDRGYSVGVRGFFCQTAFNKGVINIKYTTAGTDAFLEMNFHKDSKDHRELISWLQAPVSDIQKEVVRFAETMNINLKDV